MATEDVAQSRVRLTAEVRARDLQDRKHSLTRVGETMVFITQNFSEGRKREEKWRLAAKALESAARTDTPIYCEIATKAVQDLLKSEGMLE
jgi:hypothetical protein